MEKAYAHIGDAGEPAGGEDADESWMVQKKGKRKSKTQQTGLRVRFSHNSSLYTFRFSFARSSSCFCCVTG